MRMAGAVALPLALALAGTLAPAQAGAAPAGCQSWTGTQPPNPGPTSNALRGVTVLSACDVWAVGSFVDAQGVEHALTEHWNGASWTVVHAPDQGNTDNVLSGVRAASATNIWAVGFSDDGPSSPEKTLILRWDGKHWSRQGTPVAGQLNGVRSVSGTEAWAVGDASSSTGGTPLALHLTGGKWRRASVPGAGAGGGLLSVAASSPSDVWAVGTFFDTSGSPHARRGVPGAIRPFIVHWNGRAWTHVTSPDPGANESELNAVGVGSRTSALAVGDEQPSDGSTHTLAMRWNGKTWTRVPSPSPTPSGVETDDSLESVTVTAQGTAWAVGRTQSANGTAPLIERWDGSRWTTVPAPDLDGTGELNAVAASSASSVWAVGVMSPLDHTTRQAVAFHCC
jgi:hypothetical protein